MATTEARAAGVTMRPPELTKHDVELWSRAGLGREYLLVGRAHAGAFGTVFRARLGPRDDYVAVKVVSPARAGGTDALYDAFVSAAELARSLADDGILVPSAVGRGRGVAYQIAPWMPGGSVADMLRSGSRAPTENVIAVLRAAAALLDRAHARGVAHRGVRPGNLLFDAQGRLRIGDFGADPLLAEAGAQRAGSSVTVQAYDAPEQRRGRQVDGRGDQFSLAVIAYELLSGRSRVDVHGVEGIPTVSSLEIDAFTPLWPGLGLHVNRALRTALGAGTANRFSTVGAFVEALEGQATTVDGEKLVRYRVASLRPRATTVVLVVLAGISVAAAYLDPGARRLALDGWRHASAIASRPMTAPTVPGIRVTVLGSDGGQLPSAPVRGPARAPSATSSSSSGSTVSLDRSSGPAARRSTPDSGPGIASNNGAEGTAIRQIAAGRRMAASSLDRAATPSNARPARGSPVGPISEIGGFVQGVFRRLGLRAPADGGNGAATVEAVADAATILSVEAGVAALVTVDGIPRGAAPTKIRLTPGRHSVAVYAPGVTYPQPSTTVVVSRGTMTSVTFSPSLQRP